MGLTRRVRKVERQNRPTTATVRGFWRITAARNEPPSDL
jgi:hypothetical protein